MPRPSKFSSTNSNVTSERLDHSHCERSRGQSRRQMSATKSRSAKPRRNQGKAAFAGVGRRAPSSATSWQDRHTEITEAHFRHEGRIGLKL